MFLQTKSFVLEPNIPSKQLFRYNPTGNVYKSSVRAQNKRRRVEGVEDALEDLPVLSDIGPPPLQSLGSLFDVSAPYEREEGLTFDSMASLEFSDSPFASQFPFASQPDECFGSLCSGITLEWPHSLSEISISEISEISETKLTKLPELPKVKQFNELSTLNMISHAGLLSTISAISAPVDLPDLPHPPPLMFSDNDVAVLSKLLNFITDGDSVYSMATLASLFRCDPTNDQLQQWSMLNMNMEVDLPNSHLALSTFATENFELLPNFYCSLESLSPLARVYYVMCISKIVDTPRKRRFLSSWAIQFLLISCVTGPDFLRKKCLSIVAKTGNLWDWNTRYYFSGGLLRDQLLTIDDEFLITQTNLLLEKSDAVAFFEHVDNYLAYGQVLVSKLSGLSSKMITPEMFADPLLRVTRAVLKCVEKIDTYDVHLRFWGFPSAVIKKKEDVSNNELIQAAIKKFVK
jgi:hypothetical protein